MSETNFEIKPLDINLAKLQFNLIKQIELAIHEDKDIDKITEEYNSTIRGLNISKIALECLQNKRIETNESLDLFLKITDKKSVEHTSLITTGNREKILETIKDKSFFESCKKIILTI